MVDLILGLVIGVILGMILMKITNRSKVTYTDEIVDKGDIRDYNRQIVGKYFTIKRTYSNGKVEFRMETI